MVKKFLVGLLAVLSYAYLLRVPLGIFLVEIVFRYYNSNAYTKGMYDRQAWGALSNGAAVFLLWLALTVSFNTTVQTASRRFGTVPLSPGCEAPVPVPGIGGVWRITTWCAALVFVVKIWLLYGLAEGPGGFAMFAWGVLGFGIALAVVLVVSVQFTHEKVFSARVLSSSDWTKQPPSGYRFGDEAGGALENVHRYGFTLMAISIISFTLSGLLYRGNPSSIQLATLPCVVLILVNFCWGLSAIAYLPEY